MTITQRVIRAWRASEWAALRQVRPDGSSTEPDPALFVPQAGSSLELDDDGFMPELGANLVSSTARFPVMSAAENLVGAAQAHGAAFAEGRLATTSVGSLCRCALESSAKTIWLLSPSDRDERRARCLGFNERERSYQQPFIDIEREILNERTDPQQAADIRRFEAHVAEYDARTEAIKMIPEDRRVKPPRKFERVVEVAAAWIDENRPPHAVNEISRGMTLGAKRFYASGSSFVHGFKWMTSYIGDDEGTLKLAADGFGAAVIMTECAIALVEAQSAAPGRLSQRRKNYPDWLRSTVAAWAPRYV
ncbi:hypothetical protein ACWDTP_16180 [Mycobacterium sp. NPDC003449]